VEEAMKVKSKLEDIFPQSLPEEQLRAYPLGELQDAVREYNPQFDAELIARAHDFAQKAHHGQMRKSGDPYFCHSYAVARLLAELRMDTETIAAGLLHDTIEDTVVTKEDIAERFGDEVNFLVVSVTKLGKYKYRDREGKQAENFRKLVVASAEDIRVILIKLADRLHNLRTLEHVPQEKQLRIASESLDVYAPFAGRLGISWLKIELEDLAFRYVHPKAYKTLKRRLTSSMETQRAFLEEATNIITERLANEGISYTISSRPKHLYSIYSKMVTKNLQYDDVLDKIGIRLIVPTERDCYHMLGEINSLWRPIPYRIKDYIAMPKPNGYQSLHTTVMGPGAHPLEVQIRTPEMHRVAEEGVAAHWVYKERNRERGAGAGDPNQFCFIHRFTKLHEDIPNVREFFHEARQGLLSASVFVFTPKGEVRELPRGATAVDYAYDIHTEIGHSCVGARVNGKIVQLQHVLHNGDTVEILTHKNQTPRADWRQFVATYKARSKISHFLRQQERDYNIQIGRETLTQELRRLHHELKEIIRHGQFDELLQRLSCAEEEDLFALLGAGSLKLPRLINRMRAMGILESAESQEPDEPETKEPPAPQQQEDGILVGGMDDVLTRFAKCCLPVYGDEIVGFVTRGRGLSVHMTSCQNLANNSMESERQVSVQWDPVKKRNHYQTTIHILAHDRLGLAADIMQAITNTETNMYSGRLEVLRNRKARGIFSLMVSDLDHLERVMRTVRRVPGVISVERGIGR
jgi:GTP diphosphokinase / guanosine-3',5'-bis(diphosphate) 3'-diphosphatase